MDQNVPGMPSQDQNNISASVGRSIHFVCPSLASLSAVLFCTCFLSRLEAMQDTAVFPATLSRTLRFYLP